MATHKIYIVTHKMARNPLANSITDNVNSEIAVRGFIFNRRKVAEELQKRCPQELIDFYGFQVIERIIYIDDK